MYKLICRLAVGAGLALVAATAQAAIVTRTFEFTATNFTSFGGPVAPIETLSGSITLTYDPDVTYAPSAATTEGLVVNYLNIANDTPVGFYSLPFGSFGFGAVGGAVNGTNSGTNDFHFGMFRSWTDTPIVSDVYYTRAGFNTVWFAQSASVTVYDGPAATAPEPGAWALMIMGFGAAGATLRRRRSLAA
jgi:hypothetical protein